MNKGVVITIALSMAANIANSQTTPDPFEQVRDALEGVSVPSLITQENMEDVVVPFVTENPPEASINNATIEGEIDQRIADPDDIGGTTYNNLRDGATLRPEYDLSREDPLNLRSESIMDNAPTTSVGNLFTLTGTGVCEVDSWEGTPLIEVYCDRSNPTEERTCTTERVVTLDREDKWKCSEIATHIPRLCVQQAVVTCEEASTCFERGIVITSPDTRITDKPPVEAANDTNAYHLEQDNSRAILTEYSYNGNVTPGPQPTTTRQFSFYVEDWVVLSKLEVKISWPYLFFNDFIDCRPTVNFNGYTILQEVVGSGDLSDIDSPTGLETTITSPCRGTFSTFYNDDLEHEYWWFYPTLRKTIDLLPMVRETGINTIDYEMTHYSNHGAEFVLTYEGHCCGNPDVTYEDVSCE